MMTLDGAIKHAEEVAEEQDKLCKRYDDASGYSRSHNESIRVADAKRCEKCAEEHRQLAEWLKDYKRLLEQKSCEDAVSRTELKKWLDMNFSFGGSSRKFELFDRLDKELPPVKPARKKGKWIIDDVEPGRIWHCHCSECKKDPQGYIGGSENWWVVRLPKYCPYCGSRNEV